MTPLQALKDARQLLTDPEHWTQGHYAKNDRRRPCEPESPDAVCWCSAGAIHRAVGAWQVYLDAYKALEDGIPGGPFPSAIGWNDTPERTHAEVLAAFDAAIARLEAQG